MGQPCSICSHDQHHQINIALVSRDSYRDVAGQFSVSKSALQRHSREHIPELLVKAYEAIERDDAEDLAGELVRVKTDVHRLRQKAEGEGDLRTALLGCDKALKALELQAKVEQLIQTQPTVNIALIEHPDYGRLRAAVVGALEEYPEARFSVARALRGIE